MQEQELANIRTHRKIPKISPGAYIFQRPSLKGLFLKGFIFEGACVRREICVSKSIGLACSGREIYHFCFVLLCIREQIPSTSPPGGLCSEGRFNGGFFALWFWGAYIRRAYTWRGIFSELYGIIIIIIHLHIYLFLISISFWSGENKIPISSPFNIHTVCVLWMQGKLIDETNLTVILAF